MIVSERLIFCSDPVKLCGMCPSVMVYDSVRFDGERVTSICDCPCHEPRQHDA